MSEKETLRQYKLIDEAFNNGYAQAIADERERINKAIDEEIKKTYVRDNKDNFSCGLYSGTINGFEKAKEIINEGK